MPLGCIPLFSKGVQIHVFIDGKVRENMHFLWFLPLALMTCFSSAKHNAMPCIGMCSIQQNKPRSNRRNIRREKVNGKSALQTLKLEDHDNRFRDGQFEKTRKNLEKGQTKKKCPGELGGIYAAHGVDTRLAAAAPSALRMGRRRNIMITNTSSTTPAAAGFWSRAGSLIPGTNLDRIVTIVWFSYLHINIA